MTKDKVKQIVVAGNDVYLLTAKGRVFISRVGGDFREIGVPPSLTKTL